ncbi:lytic transglycosylase domain-containing protein [Sphingomonas koreensis]|uniref:Lytic transglycosylase n=1 Tax=Sphingomonas koreensis TaxID=93064 RepID=A0A1L6J889_9SPHN|nr:lytic transglycosylase domain-containing protein [Sphingomonas koreensis]APR52128.1 lytic transglycosylase [Sphingomonas koreensis]RSU22937.1 lytic transglycosylase domain-containing protein [Sphingomonas koreensis]RSU26802.1 lytic transglycosylase domain-containing protein [Sphingomonas koreensis]RSU30589.1 lytic transglycosylase domain-containing protein [Sphingomonas koreensis]RSU36954.1 lytic transglycosylase domain-containing protein [Sphingomonas koreensis]
MGTMRLWIVNAALALASPAQAETVADWRPYITEASARFGVPTAWIERVMQAESRGRTTMNGRPIRSSAGAIGLMQLMPDTWADMRARLALGANPDDPRDNILAGTLYLRLMYDRFGYPGLFAAYNAGPGRYAEHLSGRRALPAETVGYLASVAPTTSSPVSAPVNTAPPPSLFAVRRDLRPVGQVEAKSSPASTLFVALSQRD